MVLGAPLVLNVNFTIKASAIFAFAIIGLSLVVLTGWAGQISLGQMAIVGIGAAVSATCTSRWHVDLTLGLLIGGCAGGIVAFAVGVPALRLRGLYLAVTTFALGLATEQWLLSDRFFGWFPKGDSRFERPPLFGQISLDTPVRYYMYSLAVLVLTFLATRGIRRSRTGRVIVAVRENERAAQSYSIPAVRAKLTAFVISGVLAGIGAGGREAARRAAQRHRLADQLDAAQRAVFDALRDPEMLDLRVGENLVDRIDRACRHAGGRRRARGDERFEDQADPPTAGGLIPNAEGRPATGSQHASGLGDGTLRRSQV